MILDNAPAVEYHYTVPSHSKGEAILFATRHHQTPCSENASNLEQDYGKSQTLQGGLANQEGYNELTKTAKAMARQAPRNMRFQLIEVLHKNPLLIGLSHIVVTSSLSRCIQTAFPLAKALAKEGVLHDLTDASANWPYQIAGNSSYQAGSKIVISENLIHIPIKNGSVGIKGVTADRCKIWISEDPVRVEIRDAKIDEDLFTIIVDPLDLAYIDVVINGISLSLNPDWREVIHGWADGKITASKRNALVKAFDKKMKELASEFFSDMPVNPNFQTLFNPLNIVVDPNREGSCSESIQEVVNRAFKASKATAQKHPNKLVLVVSSTGILQSFMTAEKLRQEESKSEFPLYYFEKFLQGSQGCLIRVDSDGSVIYESPIDVVQH